MSALSAVSNAQLDDAYALYYDAGNMAQANIYGDEIISRHFDSIGAFFTFDFFARYFPKYNVRVNLSSTVSMVGTVLGVGAQGAVNLPERVIGGAADIAAGATSKVASSLLPLVVVAVMGGIAYLLLRDKKKQ